MKENSERERKLRVKVKRLTPTGWFAAFRQFAEVLLVSIH